MRNALVVLWILFCSIATADAQVRLGVAAPGVSIGINLPVYPQLVPVPGYPVYYAPQVEANYFFYDGMYWVYDGENWYASSWYNGPWAFVAPDAVPVYVLRVPVRYYRRPPVYFRGWRADAPPRWGDHWGNAWVEHHRDWDRWDRRSLPARAPLPLYQRQYSGDRYPHADEQRIYHSRNYRYQPQDAAVRQHYEAQRIQGERMPGPNPREGARERGPQSTGRGEARTHERSQAPEGAAEHGEQRGGARNR